jgi:RNA polymerase sigma-70 factor, ECF subfamily
LFGRAQHYLQGDYNFIPGMKEQTDKEILVAFSQGNSSAFEHIYNRFHTNIFLVAHRYIRSEEEAKDIRSKCFIKLWEHRDTLSFDTMGALFSWLRTTITNSCFDYLRSVSMRESKQPEIVKRYWQDNGIELFEASDKEAIILERLMKQIEELPPKVKEVFKKRWLGELKFREIAEELNTDVSTIKKRYARAIVLLKRNIPDTELVILFIFLFSDIYYNN